MASFWVGKEDVLGDQLVLRGDEAHHLHKVRRQTVDDLIDVVDGEGNFYRVRLLEIQRDRALGEIVEHRVEVGEGPIKLILAPALLKGQRFDFVLEKATEVGVSAIWPLESERGVARTKSEAKMERWHRLVRAAVKQCGRSRFPVIDQPAQLVAVVERLVAACDVVFMGALGGQLTEPWYSEKVSPKSSVGLLIGPEGGFSSGEIAFARERGVSIFGWGERVLRADTASVVLAGLLLHEYGQFISCEKG